MSFWMRQASVQIGGAVYDMDDFYFEFEVPFEDTTTVQTATVKIHNLAKSTRDAIKKDQPMIINAGYEGDVGAVFVGKISACSHQHSGTDWITTVSAMSAMEEWLSSKVSKSYAQGTTSKEIVSDLLNLLGVEVGEFSLKQNKVYDRGKVCSGKVKDCLKAVVVDDCKSRLLIRNDTIIINDPDKGVQNGILLTPESGLIISGQEKQDTIIAAGADSQKSSGEKNDEGKTFSRDCLLNYHIGPSEQVVIQSETLNGTFIVIKGKHTGSPKGKWLTTMELKPA